MKDRIKEYNSEIPAIGLDFFVNAGQYEKDKPAEKKTVFFVAGGFVKIQNNNCLVMVDYIRKTSDIDVKENLEGWQKMIGYVPQNIYLTDDSIQKNIAFGIDQNDINKDKINEHRYKPFVCECGRTIRYGDKARHCRTKVHKDYISSSSSPSSSNEEA